MDRIWSCGSGASGRWFGLESPLFPAVDALRSVAAECRSISSSGADGLGWQVRVGGGASTALGPRRVRPGASGRFRPAVRTDTPGPRRMSLGLMFFAVGFWFCPTWAASAGLALLGLAFLAGPVVGGCCRRRHASGSLRAPASRSVPRSDASRAGMLAASVSAGRWDRRSRSPPRRGRTACAQRGPPDRPWCRAAARRSSDPTRDRAATGTPRRARPRPRLEPATSPGACREPAPRWPAGTPSTQTASSPFRSRRVRSTPVTPDLEVARILDGDPGVSPTIR